MRFSAFLLIMGGGAALLLDGLLYAVDSSEPGSVDAWFMIALLGAGLFALAGGAFVLRRAP